MNIDFSKSFNKQFKKLPLKKQEQAKQAVNIFLNDINNPKLRVHNLKGEWLGHVSIGAGGDLRLHLKVFNKNMVLFVAIGGRSQLYR